MRKTINILGATGSIGQSAADVIAHQAVQFDVQLVTAHTNEKDLAETAQRLGAQQVVLSSKVTESTFMEVVSRPADITLAAIVGMAGLKPLMAALEHSDVVAIANKEPLVSAGPIVMAAARRHGTKILPVDSEHNAIFQVFDGDRKDDVENIILTASGGPFRTWAAEQMAVATPAQALAHPNWSMGDKISIDSATMMNKALEVIEAHYLFDIPVEKIQVLVHPQSMVHGMVEYKDGSVLTQMGPSDMRTPIANVLAWPDRLHTPGSRLDWQAMSALSFESVDHERFPAVGMAYEALRAGLWACAAMNAANEVAVSAFLNHEIGFTDIVDVSKYVLDNAEHTALSTVEDVCLYDHTVRQKAREYITTIHHKQVKQAS